MVSKKHFTDFGKLSCLECGRILNKGLRLLAFGHVSRSEILDEGGTACGGTLSRSMSA